jgi:hypothetical protein
MVQSLPTVLDTTAKVEELIDQDRKGVESNVDSGNLQCGGLDDHPIGSN